MSTAITNDSTQDSSETIGSGVYFSFVSSEGDVSTSSLSSDSEIVAANLVFPTNDKATNRTLEDDDTSSEPLGAATENHDNLDQTNERMWRLGCATNSDVLNRMLENDDTSSEQLGAATENLDNVDQTFYLPTESNEHIEMANGSDVPTAPQYCVRPDDPDDYKAKVFLESEKQRMRAYEKDKERKQHLEDNETFMLDFEKQVVEYIQKQKTNLNLFNGFENNYFADPRHIIKSLKPCFKPTGFLYNLQRYITLQTNESNKHKKEIETIREWGEEHERERDNSEAEIEALEKQIQSLEDAHDKEMQVLIKAQQQLTKQHVEYKKQSVIIGSNAYKRHVFIASAVGIALGNIGMRNIGFAGMCIMSFVVRMFTMFLSLCKHPMMIWTLFAAMVVALVMLGAQSLVEQLVKRRIQQKKLARSDPVKVEHFVRRLYEEKKPENIPKIPKIMKNYEGKEEQLIHVLERKYNVSFD